MDKYEQLQVVGEGSYGVVLKCRRRDNGQFVAIKKFIETEEDAGVRKMALREIRMLKKLRHDHLVNLIEVFRRKRRFYLVFEYLDHTLLDEMEATQGGLGEETSKKHLFQLLKGIEYCHQNSIIHRDVKPENVLLSNNGILKLCDLGFARTLAAPGEPYTEYVATRWYRAPELLVADNRYGPEVDIWAIGCLFAEMLSGDPLFPGDSDIDQLTLIVKIVGKLAPRHQKLVARLTGGAAALTLPAAVERGSLPGTGHAKEVLIACLRTEPRARPSASALLKHKYFMADHFSDQFSAELRSKLGKDFAKVKVATPHTQPSAPRTTKPRQQWTLNMVQDTSSRSRSDSNAGESLIDYSYSPNTSCPGCVGAAAPSEPSPGEPPAPSRRAPPQCQLPPTPQDEGAGAGLSPGHAKSYSIRGGESPRPSQKPLSKALNEHFQTFPIPVTNFPHTKYLKKVGTKLLVDEDLLRGRLANKKTTKKPSDLTLPYVPGASNNTLKRAKKPSMQKIYDVYEAPRTNQEASPYKSPTNLPYM